MNYQPEKNQAFINNFNTSNTVGKTAESMFMDFMAKTYPNVRVEDVSSNPDYQWSEIDFVLHHPNGRTSTVEVKGDTYSTTGNFAIEHVANKERERKGWLHSSKADSLCYIFVNGFADNSDNMFIISFDKLRTLVANNPSLKERAAKMEPQLRGEGTKTTIVKLVPRYLVKDIALTYNVGVRKTFNSHSAQAGWNR